MAKDDARRKERGAGPCAEARRALARFVESGLGRRDDASFRAHLMECADCRELYRDTLATAARLGRTLREARLERAKQKRTETTRRRILRVGAGSRGGRWSHLKLALLPAVMIFLVLRLLGGPSLVATADEGECQVSGVSLESPEEEVSLARGDWCATSVDGRMRLDGSDASFELRSETLVLVEAVAPARVRLEGGEILAQGAFLVATPFGVVEADDAHLRLALEAGELQLACLDGGVDFVSAAGRTPLVAGDTRSAGPLGLEN